MPIVVVVLAVAVAAAVFIIIIIFIWYLFRLPNSILRYNMLNMIRMNTVLLFGPGPITPRLHIFTKNAKNLFFCLERKKCDQRAFSAILSLSILPSLLEVNWMLSALELNEHHVRSLSLTIYLNILNIAYSCMEIKWEQKKPF